jgi:hypothetical protein
MNDTLTDWNGLPEMCVALLLPGEELIGIKRGEPGYFRMYDGMITGETAKIVADRINKALHVTPQQREAMYVGSLMGWNCPGARESSDLHVQARHYCDGSR